jgi:hypothetical protein
MQSERASFLMILQCYEANAKMPNDHAMLKFQERCNRERQVDHAGNAHQSCIWNAPWGVLFLEHIEQMRFPMENQKAR